MVGVNRAVNVGTSAVFFEWLEVVIECQHTSRLKDPEKVQDQILWGMTFLHGKDCFDDTSEFFDNLVNVFRLVGVIPFVS